ncbi:hypothetical protein GGR51DRAFT_511261 [Nemania sp. FL0031]|nr:hypothetical protein GGR51DRAFT_511261 [Nemania sp. FL0031]
MAEAQPSNVLSLQLGPRGSRDVKQISSECVDFIKRSSRQVRTASPPLRPVSLPVEFRPVSPPVELRPVSLPVEIILLIFECLEEPYELQGLFVLSESLSIDICFFKPRVWAHIPTFQICCATRSKAIKRYGKPRQDSLPFSERYDSVSFQRAPPTPQDDEDEPGSLGDFSTESCITYSNGRPSDRSRRTTLTGKFMRKIWNVEFDCCNSGSDSDPFEMYVIFDRLLELGFKKIRKVRINLEYFSFRTSPAAMWVVAVAKRAAAIKSMEVLEIEVREFGDPNPDSDDFDSDDPDSDDPGSDDSDSDDSDSDNSGSTILISTISISAITIGLGAIATSS